MDMKTLLSILTASVAIIGSFTGIQTTFYDAKETLLKDGDENTQLLTHCPDGHHSEKIISRNFQAEGVVSKIKVQSVKREETIEKPIN